MGIFIKRIVSGLLLMLCCVGTFIFADVRMAHAAGAKQCIALVSARTSDEYKAVWAAFQVELSAKGVDAEYQEFWSKSITAADYVAQRELIVKVKPTLLLVLGTEAAVFAQKNMSDIPAVFAMVVNPRESGIVDAQGKTPQHMAGVSLDVPIERQFAMIKEILPQVKTVGMIYDAESKEWVREQAQAAANRLDLQLKSVGLKPPYDAVRVLTEDMKGVDLLWASIDPKIYNANSAKEVLLSTMRMKLPFMAFSSKYVKAGALVALECDYAGIGKQAADIASSIFRGEDPAAVGVQTPLDIAFDINIRTAQLIRVRFADELVKRARQVYGE
jgi:putative ABC transport system substrate-binding protein